MGAELFYLVPFGDLYLGYLFTHLQDGIDRGFLFPRDVTQDINNRHEVLVADAFVNGGSFDVGKLF